MKSRFAAALVVFAALAAQGVTAQDVPQPMPPKTAQPAPAARRVSAPVPLKVTVVLSRYEGDKRLSSMPYVLGVMANDRASGPTQKTTLRMGVDVPVTQTVFQGPSDDKTSRPMSSYSYRSVGTNIDCSASFEEGTANLFQLALTVSDSSLGLDTQKRSGLTPDVPSFRNFNSSFTALLRDGQTMQYTSATDPVSGEVMKIDVTAAVMK